MGNGKPIKIRQDAVITTTEDHRSEPGNLHGGPEMPALIKGIPRAMQIMR